MKAAMRMEAENPPERAPVPGRRLRLVLPSLGVLAIVTAAAFAFGWAPLRDTPAARRAAIDELLEVSGVHEQVDQELARLRESLNRYADQQSRILPQPTDADRAAFEAARRDYLARQAVYAQRIGWAAVEGDIVRAYGDAFSLAETRALIAFYRTRAGAKLRAREPKLREALTGAFVRLDKELAPPTFALTEALRRRAYALRDPSLPVPPSAMPK